MKFKIDENLPIEFADLFTARGYGATTVIGQKLQGKSDNAISDVCIREEGILVTLDLDFADIKAYPPSQFPGFIVFRIPRQNRKILTSLFQRTIPLIGQKPLEHRLWIIEETQIRIRG